MDAAALGSVNAGGDTAVAQNVRQPGQVFFQRVESPGEQVAQVVGEYLGGFHTGALAQGLPIPLDIAPV